MLALCCSFVAKRCKWFLSVRSAGVTFVGCDKSNQKHAFKYGARKKRGDGFAGEKPHHASIAPTHKMVLSPVLETQIRSYVKPHSVTVYSRIAIKSKLTLSFSPRILGGNFQVFSEFICSA